MFFTPKGTFYWWGIHGTMMADTLFHPPPQSPNLSNQSQKLCYEEAIKLNIRPNTCRLADCFPGHKGCFITNVLMFGMEKLLYQISEFISLQTRFLSNKRAISYTCWPHNCVLVWSWSKDHSWSLHSLPLAKFWKYRWTFGAPLWINWFVLTLK